MAEQRQLARRANGAESTDLAPSQVNQDAMAIATTRAAQEVQAAMVVAKKFPRDVFQAERRILDACKRPALAEAAIYAYPRGGTTVEGPSIRLAEVLAQNWGNLDTGIIELEQKGGESVMMAYCWDLETNTRQTKVFAVKHERHTRQGVTHLSDPRDIYEMTANQGARRQRACILGVIPGDIVEAAVAACNKTMAGGSSEPLMDRVKKMVGAFEALGVTKDKIEKRLGHRIDTINETEFVGFRKVYKAIQDNMQPVSAYFGDDLPGRGTVDVDATLGRATETPTKAGGSSETAPKPAAPVKQTPETAAKVAAAKAALKAAEDKTRREPTATDDGQEPPEDWQQQEIIPEDAPAVRAWRERVTVQALDGREDRHE